MHAYLIMAHKNQDQLIRLIKQLDDKDNDIFLHIDKKSIDQFNIIALKKCCTYSNIYILQPITVFWGSSTEVACELALLREASSKKCYDYYHLISGQDFPLKSQKVIHDFFKENAGKEFVNFSGKNVTGFGIEIRDRVDYKWHTNLYDLFKSNLYRKIVMRLDVYMVKLKKKLCLKKSHKKYFHGANWFDITHDLAIDVVNNEDKILNRYKDGFCVDEVFLQTFIIDHGYLDRVYDSNNAEISKSIKREIDWNRGNPYTWRYSDLNYLKSCSSFFVRKIDEDLDSRLIEGIEQFLKES